jgi:hypothetical protein
MKRFRDKKDGNGVEGRPFALALSLAILASAIWAALALAAGAPIISGTAVSHIGDTSARFEATLNPNEREVKTWFFEYAGDASFKEKGFEGASKTPSEKLPAGKEGVPVSAQVSGLSPGTTYHFRLFAQNQAGKTEGPAMAFTTYVTPEPFEPCPNDAFRTGQPAAHLPDCRAYEQASPVDKNGGDLTGSAFITRASANGDRVIFQAASPIPGGEGSQVLTPIYLAGREGGGWSTQGLQPPQREGQETTLTNWTPDLSYTFSWVKRYGSPSATALLERSLADRSVTTVLPHTAAAHRPQVAGSSEDGSIVFFENGGTERGDPLTANAAAGPNLYVWDRATNAVRLAGVFNDGTAPPAGSFAGPYGWTINHSQLSFGGVNYFHYVGDLNAIAPDGSSVYFTAARTGQLYLRLNPAEPQSPLNGPGECTDPTLACTIHVSSTEKDNGPEGGPDPAGPHPAAFMGASRDGSLAYFTSSEMLTNDADTGPEQPLPRIGRAKVGGEKAEELEESFLAKKHAVGVAVDPKGEYVYWADPSLGTIGRAKLVEGKPTDPKDEFIVPGETSFEAKPVKDPGVLTSGPSIPRYVAVDGEYVYWTNTGPLVDGGRGPEPWESGGTIGRAKLNGSEPPSQGAIEPEFITGASDPQGIAVDSEHIYWANGAAEGALEIHGPAGWISRATIDGEGVQVEPKFTRPESFQGVPQTLTLSGNHLYFSAFEKAQQDGRLFSYPLEGGKSYTIAILPEIDAASGIAADGAEVYWSEGSGGIGRVPDNGPVAGYCREHPDCEAEYLKPEGSVNGLALDGTRLYWGSNGEGGSNAGNDLYRYEVKTGQLTDVAPDSGPGAANGAEVKGVLGASQDGSYLYFVANGALAEGAGPGDCHGTSFDATSGECNLYLAHEGRLEFITRLKGEDGDDWRGADVPNNGNVSFKAKVARVSADGRTLLFTSTQKLTAYENEGKPELYLYRVGAAEPIICVSCNPTGQPPSAPPSLGSEYGGVNNTGPAPVMSRNLAADGRRVFFESSEALLAADVNGAEGCALSNGLRQCQDVYEWESKGAGSCRSEAQNGGCLYLISSGQSSDPSVLIDASRSGDDVFFFTRSALVGQDADSFVDVYDARVGGGLVSQAKATPPPPCEGEACKGGATPPPAAGSPATPLVSGPPNPKPRHKKTKPNKHHKHHKKHAKKHKRGAHNKGRAGR